MTKLVENIQRAVNIGLVLIKNQNNLGGLEGLVAVMKTFGFMPFFPGPGLGGHCIPIDPYYLT